MKPQDYIKDPQLYHVCTKNKLPYWLEEIVDKMSLVNMISDVQDAYRRIEEYQFGARTLALDFKAQRWTFNINLASSVPRIGSRYFCALFWSPVNIEREIKQYKDNITKIKNDPTLLKEEDEAKIEEQEENIAKAKDRLEDRRSRYPTILLYADVASVEYGAPTKLEIGIAMPTAIEIAKNAIDIQDYTIALVENVTAAK